MKKLLVLAGLLSLVATPALAYPTSILSIPTAGTLEAGKLHLGFYSGNHATSGRYGDFSLNAGAFNGFDIGGFKVGALELGFDAQDPAPGSIFSLTGKLSLLGETDYLPGVAVGTYYLGAPSMDASPNLAFASLSKSLALGDISLGSWTLGVVKPSPLFNNGAEEYLYSAGMTYDLPISGLGLAADYTSGTSAYSMGNVGLYYSPIEDLSLTLGWCMSNNRETPNDYPMLFIDYTLPLTASK